MYCNLCRKHGRRAFPVLAPDLFVESRRQIGIDINPHPSARMRRLPCGKRRQFCGPSSHRHSYPPTACSELPSKMQQHCRVYEEGEGENTTRLHPFVPANPSLEPPDCQGVRVSGRFSLAIITGVMSSE